MSPVLINPFRFGGGGGGPFSPDDIAGLDLWLDAEQGVFSDAGSTPAGNTDLVQQWNDQSGNANHYTQATSGNRPTYRTGVINGRPALRFDNSNDYMGGIVVGTPYTIFVVYSQRGTNATRRALAGSNNWLVGPYSGVHRGYAGGFLNSSLTSTSFRNGMVWVCVTNSGAASKYYRNGFDRTTNGTFVDAPGTLYLGGGAGFSVEPLDGDIAEVLVYNTVLSDANRQSVDAYLYARWALGGDNPGPTAIEGCFLWLKADAGVYTDAGSTLATNGQTVQQWNDQSGSGNHYVQATSGLRPTWVTGVMNGFPCVRFDGTDDTMGGIEVWAPYTLFVVYSQRTAGSAQRRALTGVENWLLGPYNNKHRAHSGQFLDANTQAVTQDVLVRSAMTNDDNGVGAWYLGGTDFTNAQPTTHHVGVLSVSGNATWPDYLLGDVAEVIGFNRLLTSGERAAVDAYLAGRWD